MILVLLYERKGLILSTNSSPPRPLALNRLSSGEVPMLTFEGGQHLAQACAVRLDEQRHPHGVSLLVEFHDKLISTYVFTIDEWEEITPRHLSTWGDPEYTTEHAACGIACLLAMELTDYTVIYRSRKGPGFDYWLGSRDALEDPPFTKYDARLEVSGIRQGKKSDIKQRVKGKLNQTKPSDGSTPAYIVVVEFGTPTAHMVKK